MNARQEPVRTRESAPCVASRRGRRVSMWPNTKYALLAVGLVGAPLAVAGASATNAAHPASTLSALGDDVAPQAFVEAAHGRLLLGSDPPPPRCGWAMGRHACGNDLSNLERQEAEQRRAEAARLEEERRAAEAAHHAAEAARIAAEEAAAKKAAEEAEAKAKAEAEAAKAYMESCYDKKSVPPEGYVFDPSDLEFSVDRTSEPALAYTTESARFADLTCDAPLANKFSNLAWCEDNSCDSTCMLTMPAKCDDAEHFGVCAGTVTRICDSMHTSYAGCKEGATKAQSKAAAYDSIDVGSPPCSGDIQQQTKQALDAYKAAYNNWATAFNSVTSACKVGSSIFEYNTRSFADMKDDLEHIQQVATDACDREAFDPSSVPLTRAELGFFRRLRAAIHNHVTRAVQHVATGVRDLHAHITGRDGEDEPTKEPEPEVKPLTVCEKMKANLATLRDNSQTSNKQVQCYAARCSREGSVEANAFEALKTKYEAYKTLYGKYAGLVDDFNKKIVDKSAAKAAAISEQGLFNDAMEDINGKFSKDAESFDAFVNGDAKEACGLSKCEIHAACGFEIQARTEEYAAVKGGECKSVDFDESQYCQGEE